MTAATQRPEDATIQLMILGGALQRIVLHRAVFTKEACGPGRKWLFGEGSFTVQLVEGITIRLRTAGRVLSPMGSQLRDSGIQCFGLATAYCCLAAGILIADS